MSIILERVKWAMVESVREVCGSMRVGRKEPKECVLGSRCLQLAMKRQKKNVWKLTE